MNMWSSADVRTLTWLALAQSVLSLLSNIFILVESVVSKDVLYVIV